MFESAELGHEVDKRRYQREAPKLREALLDVQQELRERKPFSVVIVVHGVDGAGKSETVNLMHSWLDPRHIKTRAFGPIDDAKCPLPRIARFYDALPQKGQMGILFGAWYADPLLDRTYRRTKQSELDQRLEEIVRFETMLVEEGALLLKFWLHLSKAGQKKRLRELEKDPETSWRVGKRDWDHFEHYDAFRKVSEHALQRTSTEKALWTVVESSDARYRQLTVGRAIEEAMRERLAERQRAARRRRPLAHSVRTATVVAPKDQRNLLGALDLSLRADKKEYERELSRLQGELNQLSRKPAFAREHAAVVVFEGNDAAGKGGNIRRIVEALDARSYDVIPTAAPNEEERGYPYLWRFARHVPTRGRFTLYDRSWYGRVLVERVEGLCSREDWLRGYSEINDFEQQLTDHGIVVVKFWLAISKHEQEQRFAERTRTGFKRFKITKEDYRNRKKWDAYEQAALDMFDQTSTDEAPWTLVEANDKQYARLKVLSTLVRALERAL